ncbi:MAG: hypothetical protein JWP52_2861 [Rhizobacter sp.]|nr:hypothetical protein [Rhizobacter sp.]
MSLATRCTACGTVFRVVQDQLKVSEGWVRCGKCHEVFNALEGLVDLQPKLGAQTPEVPASGFAPSPSPASAAGTGEPPFGSRSPLFQQPFFTPPAPAASPASPPIEPEVPASFVSSTDMTLLEQAAAQADADDAARLRDAEQAVAEQLRLDEEEAEAAMEAKRDAEAAMALRRPAIEARAFHADVDDGRGEPSLADPPFIDPDFVEPSFEPSVHSWSRDEVLRDDHPDSRPFAPSRHPAFDEDPEPLIAVPQLDPFPAGEPVVEPPSPISPVFETEAAMPVAGTVPVSAPASFLRDAERRARRDTPLRRAGLSALAVLLVLGLALQVAFSNRDVMAARWPALAPSLSSMCGVAGCRIEAPRRIDEVVVDSSALTRLDGVDGFRLSVVLRNRSSMALQLPSIDLSLTDSDGKLVARRALQAADFSVASTTLSASGEQSLQMLLSTGDRRVTGYTVELFYP